VTWQWYNQAPDIVRAHIDDLGGRSKQLDGVDPRPLAQRRVAVPMTGVNIGLVAKADQVPSDPLAVAHDEAIETAIEHSIEYFGGVRNHVAI
jgi:hypothetical protein